MQSLFGVIQFHFLHVIAYMRCKIIIIFFFFNIFVAFSYNLLLSLKTINILFFRLFYKQYTCQNQFKHV